jgi:uncharacterized protein YbgA (DUF1722 family)/uncharacterized protein YbbK (DUF523 family)
MERPKILVSSCILGNNVRYDGGNKLDHWVSTKLSQYTQLVSVCPEVEMGLGTPREAINLHKLSDGNIKIFGSKSKIDHTENAITTADNIIMRERDMLCGAILQKKSPSCGVERVKLYNDNNQLLITDKKSILHRGIFAKKLIFSNELLPVIDSGRLFDQNERENFLRRVYAFFRFSKLDGTIKALQDFHSRYKFVIMEHHQNEMRALGNIAANSTNENSLIVYKNYSSKLFLVLQKIPTKKSRTNVFYHLIGFFKNDLEKIEKEMIHQMIDDYNKGLVPYLVPYKMLELLITKHQQYYLKNHYFLNQFPKELIEA